MILVPLCIGLIVGMIVGRLFREPDNDCPQVEIGYRCRGDLCNHAKSLLYEGKMHMAIERERRHRDNDGKGA